jgi:menaquinone-dependent protoporphyrinogen oxidase
MHVLVGYASAQGSTAEVARRIGSVIETGGMSVDVLPIKDVASLVDYDAVVLGSAIHTQSWLPEATDFMQTHATELSARPVWLFSVGMSAALPRALRHAAQVSQEKHLLKTLSKTPMRGHTLYSGVSSPEQMPRWVQILFRLLGGSFGDFRDWPAIESWARTIANQLSLPPAGPESLQIELQDAASGSWLTRILQTLVSQYGRTQLRFVARAQDGRVLYESDTFSGPPLGGTPPREDWAPGMENALKELTARTRSDGWHETLRGKETWQLSFARSGT